MENLSEIYALIDSKDETNIQLAFAMWSGIDNAGFEAFKMEWAGVLIVAEMGIVEYFLRNGLSVNLVGKKLKNLPKLPSFFLSLFCYNNRLTALPTLPATLQRLDCDNNQLTELPPIPQTLTCLYCRNNYLTEEPKVPEGCELLFYTQKQRTKAVSAVRSSKGVCLEAIPKRCYMAENEDFLTQLS